MSRCSRGRSQRTYHWPYSLQWHQMQRWKSSVLLQSEAGAGDPNRADKMRHRFLRRYQEADRDILDTSSSKHRLLKWERAGMVTLLVKHIFVSPETLTEASVVNETKTFQVHLYSASWVTMTVCQYLHSGIRVTSSMQFINFRLIHLTYQSFGSGGWTSIFLLYDWILSCCGRRTNSWAAVSKRAEIKDNDLGHCYTPDLYSFAITWLLDLRTGRKDGRRSDWR